MGSLGDLPEVTDYRASELGPEVKQSGPRVHVITSMFYHLKVLSVLRGSNRMPLSSRVKDRGQVTEAV